MATATFSGQYGHNMTLEVWSGWNRQDVANNRSTVNVQARLITNGYASMWGVTADLTITINGGSAIEHPVINIGTGSSQLIFAHDYVVGHNNDGSKTVGIKISVNLNSSGYGSSMVAFDLKLPNIPRASSGSVTSGDLGSAVKISIDRKVSSFKHTLRYDWNGVTGTIASNIDTSYSWTLPMSFADKIPNATSSWGRVFIDTYNGSTKIGTKEATFTGNVPASVKPTLGSITLDDTNTNVKNLINTSNTFVQVLSNPKVTFNNAKGSYSSTITNYHAEIVDRNISTTSNNGELGIMSFSGSVTVRATVTDSRGRTSEPVEVEVNVLPYFTPQLSFTAQRSGSAGTTITVTRNAKVAPLTVGDEQKNTMKLSFKYKTHSGTTYTADTGSAGGTWTTLNELVNSQANLGATFNTLTTYVIVGKIEDSFTSYDFSATVGTEKFPLAIRPDRIGLGKVPEKANAIDSAWAYYYKNKPIQHHQVTNNDGRIIQVAKNTDMDTIVETGFYCGEGLLHRPTGSGIQSHTYFRVLRFDTNAVWCLQEAIDFNGKVSAFRVKRGSNWDPWQYYAIQNTVAEFTAVNQTKVYRATLAGPYGLSAQATRCGNIVNLSINCTYQHQHSISGTANETIPVGWKPTTAQIITLTGHAGGGTGTEHWSDSFADLHYETDGKIKFTIKTKGKPLAMMGSITWITTDPFPSE